ncbi:RNA-splicing ligase RtcB [Methanosarcinales archaeon]|nr:MAG: RNA-splicing ligase RtcB [Methanosarcinales archaeon]
MVDVRNFERINEYMWRIPKDEKYGMRSDAVLFVSELLLRELESDAITQLKNVATLPGIVGPAMAMPDVHMGYGFPIGGVAAFDDEEGVISPGGVGFDINCGVRILRTPLKKEEVIPKMRELTEVLFRNVPSGVGSEGKLRVGERELREVLVKGSEWAVENGYGVKEDLVHCENGGRMKEASYEHVSREAFKRGKPQLGTLGSGNHFLEIQYVAEVYDDVYGFEEGDVTVMIHCGSRGCGHQICTDHLKVLTNAYRKYGIELKDRQLACAPVNSPEGMNYFSAMAAAANYAWANRQIITHWVRESFSQCLGVAEDDIELVYDVAHNIAKHEYHTYQGKKRGVYVHRKGATRALPKGHPDVPPAYRKVGQPVLIPGSMGTPSFILKGGEKALELSFGSACHGSGRVMSRHEAKSKFSGAKLIKELEGQGVIVRAASKAVVAEEAPDAYKDSSEVVDVVHNLGIATKVVMLKPMGVVKG